MFRNIAIDGDLLKNKNDDKQEEKKLRANLTRCPMPFGIETWFYLQMCWIAFITILRTCVACGLQL